MATESASTVTTAAAPLPRGHYAQARVAGNFVFTAGFGPLEPATREIVGPNDVVEQTRQVFRNLAAVLSEAGCTLADVVQVTAFLQNVERDWGGYDSVFPEFFGEPYPARLTAGATLGDILVEIEVVAYRPATCPSYPLDKHLLPELLASEGAT